MSKNLKRLIVLVLGLSCAAALHAQTVKGVVKDGNGEPLMGAFVMVQGTTNGTATGLDGDYSIDVADASTAVLEFSLIGMKTVTIPVSGRAVVDAVLEDDTTVLDEVVVVGYATVKKARPARIGIFGKFRQTHRTACIMAPRNWTVS